MGRKPKPKPETEITEIETVETEKETVEKTDIFDGDLDDEFDLLDKEITQIIENPAKIEEEIQPEQQGQKTIQFQDGNIELPKRGRGRPKKDPNQSVRIKEVTEDKQQVKVNFINGKNLLLLIDTVLPMLISFSVSRFMKKKVNRKNLKLDEDEKADLIEVADAVASRITATATPEIVLGVALFVIYGSKTMAEIED